MNRSIHSHGRSLWARSANYRRLAWTAGFLAVVAPAGAGVREVALGAVLAGAVGPGALVVVVLAVRLTTTIADVVLGVGASLAMRKRPGPPRS